jgi:hypothetical protein
MSKQLNSQQRRAVGQDQRAASTDSWLCEEVHRLYNKRATGEEGNGAGQCPTLDNGPPVQIF